MLGTTKYTKKCMALLNTGRFKKVTIDLTAATEQKIQKVLRKIKSEQEYKRLYSTSQEHKLKNDRVVDEFPMRPIISNFNTASYEFTKYLAKLLPLLSTSEYTVKSTNELITHI